MTALAILLPYIEKYGAELVFDAIDACKKRGITMAELNTMFADVKTYNELGINPNAPVKAE